MFRIVHVTTDLRLAGRERVVVELANQQARNGYDVSIACLRMEGKLKDHLDPGIEVFTCWAKKGLKFNTIWKLASFLKEKRPEIVHTHNPGTLLYGNIAARLARVPLIVNTEHGFSEPTSVRSRLKEAALYKLTHKVTVVSSNLKSRIQKTYWASEEKIIVIPNGISRPRITKSPEDVRVELGMSVYETNIGIVGRLALVKNHQMLLRAFEMACRETSNLRLWIIGVGPLQKELENMCYDLGLFEKVYFTGFRGDAPEIIKALDILVLCSLSEGMSITILEAMALEVPIIATNVGGNIELIQDGINGKLISVGDVKGLKDGILSYRNDSQIRKKYVREGKNRFLKFYSTEKMSLNYNTLYMELTKNLNR